MPGKLFFRFFLCFAFMLACGVVNAQISPGDLSSPHSNLEGLSNCTKCHVLGSKIANDKCLACHTEINDRISKSKGYHSSAVIKSKECISCHSDHHGKNFKMIRFDVENFDHGLTGYTLSQPHSKLKCNQCHVAKFITDTKLKQKKETYLGLSQVCLNCHTDYHQKTLPENCLLCHDAASFKSVPKFNHQTARFHLGGKHVTTACAECHKTENRNGEKFQVFRLGNFNCSDCHKDPHQNKFGQNCSQCHNEDSFLTLKSATGFDHNTTRYKLEAKHTTVSCKECHKTKFTDHLKYNKCTDCHTDYHKGQFIAENKKSDCSDCHSVQGFNMFSFTTDQHNVSAFPLKGSHMAVPCTDCHKKQKEWSFRSIGKNCVDCHTDIHKGKIDPKLYPGGSCITCHNEKSWRDLTFDHSKTKFNLTGAHLKQDCIACHVPSDKSQQSSAKFSELSTECSSCHKDVHNSQFEANGITACVNCHTTNAWKPSVFNHKNSAFPLDGKHVNVPCIKCHKPVQEGNSSVVKYKLKIFTCETCHS